MRKFLSVLALVGMLGLFNVVPARTAYADTVGYNATMFTVVYCDSNGGCMGGSAGMGEPTAEDVEMGAPAGAVTGSCLVEVRRYDENGLDYTVLERSEFTISFGP